MLKIAADLSRYRLGAGEPFILELAFQDVDGTPQDLSTRGFALTFFRADRSIAQQLESVLQTDTTVARFEEDGSFSETLATEGLLQVEVAERFHGGRDVLALGTVSVDATALSVPDLPGALLARLVWRATWQTLPTPSCDVALIMTRVPYALPAPPVVGAPIARLVFSFAANTMYLGAL